MSTPESDTDAFHAEQMWWQRQYERHQRFLTQLKAEFQALHQQQPRSYSVVTYVPQPTASTANGQRHNRSRNTPQRPRSPIAAKP